MCTSAITEGIIKDCKTVNGAVGVDKDLILVNYSDFDYASTFAGSNREIDNTNGNIKGLTDICLKTGAEQYTFEGTDYSVIPSIIPVVKEDGSGMMYGHQILFTVYSKKAKDRKILEDLGTSRVIGICRDRSTGLYELFGAEKGLKVSSTARTYTGAQNSNFYQVTIVTPEIGVVKESTLGELATRVVVL